MILENQKCHLCGNAVATHDVGEWGDPTGVPQGFIEVVRKNLGKTPFKVRRRLCSCPKCDKVEEIPEFLFQ